MFYILQIILLYSSRCHHCLQIKCNICHANPEVRELACDRAVKRNHGVHFQIVRNSDNRVDFYGINVKRENVNYEVLHLCLLIYMPYKARAYPRVETVRSIDLDIEHNSCCSTICLILLALPWQQKFRILYHDRRNHTLFVPIAALPRRSLASSRPQQSHPQKMITLTSPPSTRSMPTQ